MWESIKEVLVSENFLQTVVGVGALIIILAVLAKRGLLSFKGKGLTIGTAESERTIVRNQIEFCKTWTENLTSKMMAHFNTVDEWRIRYTSELVFDILIEMVSFNHITKDDFYIKNKFDKVWAVFQKEGMDDESIKQYIESECKKVVERLVDIKEYYSK